MGKISLMLLKSHHRLVGRFSEKDIAASGLMT
jgi:hypothetical protein